MIQKPFIKITVLLTIFIVIISVFCYLSIEDQRIDKENYNKNVVVAASLSLGDPYRVSKFFREFNISWDMSKEVELFKENSYEVYLTEQSLFNIESDQGIVPLTTGEKRTIEEINETLKLKGQTLLKEPEFLYSEKQYDVSEQGNDQIQEKTELLRINLNSYALFNDHPVVNVFQRVLLGTKNKGEKEYYVTFDREVDENEINEISKIEIEATQESLVDRITKGDIYFVRDSGYDADFRLLGEFIAMEPEKALEIQVSSPREALLMNSEGLVPVVLLNLRVNQTYVFDAFVPQTTTYSGLDFLKNYFFDNDSKTVVHSPIIQNFDYGEEFITVEGEYVSENVCISNSKVSECDDYKVNFMSTDLCEYEDLEETGDCYYINDAINSNTTYTDNNKFRINIPQKVFRGDFYKRELKFKICISYPEEGVGGCSQKSNKGIFIYGEVK